MKGVVLDQYLWHVSYAIRFLLHKRSWAENYICFCFPTLEIEMEELLYVVANPAIISLSSMFNFHSGVFLVFTVNATAISNLVARDFGNISLF